MKKVLFYCFICIQTLAFGQDPASIKWKQINSDIFQLIYPENYDSVAKRIGSMLLIENKFETFNMKCKPKKISIILHNQSSMSNGWVALAPRRVEFFHTPTQASLSPMDWNASLALHEYRHVIQYEMLRKGITGKILFLAWGNIGWAVKSVTTPNWFFEGDAVATETSLSKSGRGRSPDFSKDLRAQLLDKKKYSYSKATCGSYKDYVPNHYVLGYNLVAYGRYVWNANLWRIAQENSANVLGFTPFSKGIKKETGLNKTQFYNQALDDLSKYWNNQLSQQKNCYFETVRTSRKATFTNYNYPYKLQDNSILALKTGMGDIPTIVTIAPNGDETNISEVSFITNENPINSNGDQVVWVQEYPDLRWNMRSYSDILKMDLSNKTTVRLTKMQHYYSPAISPDGTKIITVEVTEKAKYRLVILDAQTGSVIKKINSPKNEFILTPRWNSNNKTVVCILLSKIGKTLTTLNTENDFFTNYSEPSFTDISEPFFHKNYIIYTSEHNGINNEIYAFDTISKNCFQITNTRFGCRNASITKDNYLLFSTYSSDGDFIGTMPFDNRQWKPSDFTSPQTDTLVQGLLKDELGVPDLFDTTQTPAFLEKPYNKALHILNPHSWGLGINTNSQEEKRNENNISIMSQNNLGTMDIVAGRRYDKIGSEKGYITATYTGFFPIIQLDYEKGTHGYLPSYREKQKIVDFVYDTLFHNDRTVFSQVISFPFNLSSNNYGRYIGFTISNTYQNIGNYYIEAGSLNQSFFANYTYKTIQTNRFAGYIDYLNFQIGFSNIKASPKKNLLPTWGQTITIGYSKFIALLDNFKSTYSLTKQYRQNFDFVDRIFVKSTLYFPGPIKHHGISISGGYTQVDVANSKFSTQSSPIDPKINFARGYNGYSGVKYNSYSLISANYSFTIINPDLSLPSILYLKRIYATLFADYSTCNSVTKSAIQTTNYSSFGMEIYTQSNIINSPNFSILFGGRFSSIDPLVGQTRRRLFPEILLQLSY